MSLMSSVLSFMGLDNEPQSSVLSFMGLGNEPHEFGIELHGDR